MEIATKIAPLGLALIMLGLGMSLTTKDFARVIKFPKDFLVGFICQMLVLPIIAFALIKLLNTPIMLFLFSFIGSVELSHCIFSWIFCEKQTFIKKRNKRLWIFVTLGILDISIANI